MFNKTLLAAIIFIITHFEMAAQDNTSIAILSRYHAGDIGLRWAPANAATWKAGNNYGYTIERFTILPNGDMEENTRVVLTNPSIRPVSESKFEEVAKNSKEAAVVQELLYSKDDNSDASANDLSGIWSRNKELDNRFGIVLLMCDLSLETATAAGLYYQDVTAQKGKRYVYRIRVIAPAKEIASGVKLVNAVESGPPVKITDLKAAFANGKVTLSWSTLLHKGVYSAYHIERSTDGKNFTRLSDLPYVHMTEDIETETAYYIDSLQSNNTPYSYRITGITPFADKGNYSNIASGHGKDDLTGLLVISKGVAVDHRKVKLVWEFPPDLEDKIAGFSVRSANNPTGPFIEISKKLLPKSSREITHETAFNNTYYIVRAITGSGEEIVRSFPYLVQIADETPPAIPKDLNGLIEGTGLAKLTWTSNTDKDLLGYRVFRANSPAEEYVEVSPVIITSNSYTDSVNLQVLNKKVYYTIIAVDKNYNTSDYSPSLVLTRPDQIIPAAPLLTSLDIAGDTVTLTWINSVSDDIAIHELIRIDKTDRLSRVLLTWPSSKPVTLYRDKNLEPGRTYQYKIIATDSTKNTGQTTTREFNFEPGYRAAVSEIKSNVDRTARNISITWKNPLPSVRCIIYRKINNEELKIYETLDGNIETYQDTGLMINNVYTYKIQPLYRRGVRSIVSREIKVTY